MGEKPAGMTNSAAYEHFTGKECLDVHLLKPARLDVLPGQPDVVCADESETMMGSRRGQLGSSILIANPIRLFAGYLQNWQNDAAIPLI